MPNRVDKSRLSEKDLEELAYFIAKDDPAAAGRFLEAAENDFNNLARFPGLGGAWETDNPRYQELRVWPIRGFPNHLVFYEPYADGVRVVRVLHGARDLGSIFG